MDFATWISWKWRPVLNENPVLSDLDGSDRLIVLEIINKVGDMTEMSKLLTTTSFD